MTSREPSRSIPCVVACVALIAACAGRPWVPLSLGGFREARDVERARLTLADRSTVTVSSPTVERDRWNREYVTGHDAQRCLSGRCAALSSERHVWLMGVTAAEVWRVRPPPAARVDLTASFPFLLFAPSTALRESSFGAGATLRLATRSGFGAAFAFGGATTLSLGSLDSRNTPLLEAYISGALGDVMALYRLRPVGTDHRGFAIDILAGVSVGDLQWRRGHSATTSNCGWSFFSSCEVTTVTEYVNPPQTFSSGRRIGPALGLSFDGRAGTFLGGVSVTWRALYYIDPASPTVRDDGPVHVVIAQAYMGFGFSL